MAANTNVTINAYVKTEGLDKAVAGSKEFNNNMQAGAAALAKGKASAPAYKSAKMESEDYGKSRAIRPGGTGASARDFAQEAQGLGGLVRLYATYAANIFAVGAAFRALSNAMDTSNMVKGLDQLGAASGTALGTLAKRLVTATDGAISLREAMESVAKASSSGMSSENILRMGKVAKQASQALGVDMADAVNRITRGITKLEPELLDEIGIFTRVDSATKEYAKSVGKSAEALTDFEKRMAFANAVLAEGEKKFSAIDIDTNPYTKLLATIKDISQTGLELVNKVIAPLVGYLSQSPGALAAILSAIGVVLVKQALPAIGEFRAGLENTASKARDKAIEKAKEAEEARTKLVEIAAKQREKLADSELYKVIQTQDKLAQVSKQGQSKNTNLYKLLDADFADRSKANLALIDKLNASVVAKKEKLERDLVRLEKNQADPALITAQKEKIAVYTQGIEVAKTYSAAEGKLAETLADGNKKSLTMAANARIAQKAQESAAKQTIISNAAYNGSLLGLRDAYRLMQEDITKSNLSLTGFQKGMLTARGAVGILGGAISTLGAALSGALMWIGLIVTAVGILDGIFSTAGKAVDEFNGSTERLESAAKTLGDTFDAIYRKNPFSVESLQAQATAMLELSDSFNSVATNATKALSALGNSKWDSFKDSIKSIFGGGVQNNFEESLAKSISGAVEDLDNAPIQTKLREKLSGILNIKDVANFKQLEKALEGLDPKSEIVKKVGKALKDAAVEAGNAASKAKEFDDAFKAAEDTYKEFSKQFEVKDPLTNYATKSLTALQKLQASLDGPVEQSLANLVKVSENIKNNPIFGPDQVLTVNSYAKELVNLNAVLAKQYEIRKSLAEEQKKETPSASLAFQLQAGTKNIQKDRLQDASYNITEAKRLINRSVSTTSNIISDVTSRVAEIGRDFAKMIPAGMQNSIGYIEKGIAAAFAKGSTQFLQSVYSKISDVPELAQEESKLKLREIAIQEESIKSSMNLVAQFKINAAAIEANTAMLARNAAKEEYEKTKTPESGKAFVNAESDYKAAEEKLKAIKSIAANPLKGLRELKTALGESGTSLGKYAGELGGFAQELSGFKAELMKLGQDKKVVVLEGTLKTISSIFAVEKQRLETTGKQYTEEQRSIVYRKEQLGYMSTQLLLEQQALTEKQATLDYDKEINALAEQRTNKLALVSSLLEQGKKDQALTLKASADRVYNEGEVAAQLKKSNTLLESQQKTQKDLMAISKQRLAIDKQTAEIVKETAISAQEYALEAADLALQNLEFNRLLSETEKKQIKLKQDQDKLQFETKKKLYEAEKKYLTDIFKISDDYTDENADESERQLKARAAAYEQEKSQIINLGALRSKSMQDAFDLSEDKELLDGISDGVMKALFEGGKEGAAAIREVITAKLMKPIRIVVDAIINPITSAINNVVSSTTNSLISSGLSSVFGSGSTLTGVASTFGNSIAAGFTSTVQGWMGTTGTMSQLATTSFQAGAAGTAGSWGATIGTYLPYAAVAALVLNVLGVFRRTKQVAAGLMGTLGEGDIEDFKLMRKSGTLLQGPKYWYEKLGVSAMSEQLQSAYEGLRTNAMEMAEALGLSGDAVKDFTTTLGTDRLSDTGGIGLKLTGADGKALSEQEVQQKIADALNSADEKLAQQLIGSFEQVGDKLEYVPSVYAKEGEKANETLKRLATSFIVVNEASKVLGNSLMSASLESGAIASALIDKAGGLDAFGQKIGFVIENFYSQEEKLALTREKVSEKMSDLGYASVDTASEFRALLSSIDLTTEGGQDLYVALLDVAPAFKEVADAAIEAANDMKVAWARISTSRGAEGSDALTIQASIDYAWEQFKAEGNVFGIQQPDWFKTITREDLQNYTAEEQGFIADIVEGYSELAQLAEDAQNSAQESAANALKEAQDAAMKLVDTRLSALKRSIDAEKKILQDQLKTAEENLKSLDDLIKLLDDNITELRNSVTQTAALSAEEGSQFIANALATALSTGLLPETEAVSKAISAVRAQIEEGNYESKFDQDRAKLILAGQLDQLKAVGLEQKSSAELQIEALNAQIAALDAILTNAQAQVDALNGIYNSVQSVAAAVAALEVAIMAAKTVSSGGSSGGGSSSGGTGNFVAGPGGSPTSSGILGGTTSSTPGDTRDFYSAGETFSSTVSTTLNPMNLPVYTATINGETYTASGGGFFNPTEYLAKNDDINWYLGEYGYAGTGATNDAEFAAWHFKTYGIAEGRAYAKGGAFTNGIVTEPTMFNIAQMGEAGAEAIMPLTRGPDGSLGVTTHGTGSTGELKEEMARLRASNEMMSRQLQQVLIKIAKNTEESKDLLDDVVRGGEAITVESSIATY